MVLHRKTGYIIRNPKPYREEMFPTPDAGYPKETHSRSNSRTTHGQEYSDRERATQRSYSGPRRPRPTYEPVRAQRPVYSYEAVSNPQHVCSFTYGVCGVCSSHGTPHGYRTPQDAPENRIAGYQRGTNYDRDTNYHRDTNYRREPTHQRDTTIVLQSYVPVPPSLLGQSQYPNTRTTLVFPNTYARMRPQPR